jgi:hypothetical protein
MQPAAANAMLPEPLPMRRSSQFFQHERVRWSIV